MVGQRVYGDTDILAAPKNFNFVMRRQEEESTKMRVLMMVIAVSMVPILYNVWNAETRFKQIALDEVRERRRQKLDSTHGVDRNQMVEDFEKLDEIYRVSEKKEIKKY